MTIEIVDFPIENGDCPVRYVSLPEGKTSHRQVEATQKQNGILKALAGETGNLGYFGTTSSFATNGDIYIYTLYICIYVYNYNNNDNM